MILTIADTSDLVHLLYNNGEQPNTHISILAIAFRKRSILLMKYIQNKMPNCQNADVLVIFLLILHKLRTSDFACASLEWLVNLDKEENRHL